MGKRLDIDEDLLVKTYHETRSIVKTAKIFGLGESTVNKRLHLLNVKIYPTNALVGPENERVIAERYVLGEESGDLAKEYGCSTGTIRNIIRRVGLEVGPRGPNKKIFTDEQIKQCCDLWFELRNASKVAKHVNMTTARVLHALRLGGVDPRGVKRRGDNHPQWKGGRADDHGYWRIQIDLNDPFTSMTNWNGYVLEHRYVMAKNLGRCLEKWETVHHIDGDKKNNDISNLQLRQGRHGKHEVWQCGDCGSQNVIPVPIADSQS